MTSAQEICRMDTVTLAGHVAAKRLSPVEVVDTVLDRLDRLDRLDPALHAFTTVVPEQARQRAKHLEADIAAGSTATRPTVLCASER
jgi:aspartyl-tRNA(Asn)/glutamyl-tRNA(Gln) amidotransferase subunit A